MPSLLRWLTAGSAPRLIKEGGVVPFRVCLIDPKEKPERSWVGRSVQRARASEQDLVPRALTYSDVAGSLIL